MGALHHAAQRPAAPYTPNRHRPFTNLIYDLKPRYLPYHQPFSESHESHAAALTLGATTRWCGQTSMCSRYHRSCRTRAIRFRIPVIATNWSIRSPQTTHPFPGTWCESHVCSFFADHNHPGSQRCWLTGSRVAGTTGIWTHLALTVFVTRQAHCF